MRRFFITLAILVALTAVGGAGYLGFQSTQPMADEGVPKPITVPVTRGEVVHSVTAPGQLVGTHEELLGFRVNGRLVTLSVRPGSVVQKGEMLAQLDTEPFEQALIVARIELEQAQAAYAQAIEESQLNLENSESLVDGARAQVPSLTAAEVRLQQAIDYENRAAVEYDKALNRTWEPPAVAEAYKRELDAASAARAIAQAEVDAVRQQQWAASQQIASRQTELAQAQIAADFLTEQGVNPLLELALTQAEKDLAATTLVAPFDGVVLEVMVKPGEMILAGTPLLLLADPAAAEVRTTIIEEDLPLVQIGQTAELYFDAQPDIAVAGELARIVPQRVIGEERPLYHVYITLLDPLPPSIYPGMTADASIVIDAQEDVLRLPRALVAAHSDGTAVVDVWRNDQISQREIEIGLRGDVYTTLLDGLEEGDEVVGE